MWMEGEEGKWEQTIDVAFQVLESSELTRSIGEGNESG